MAKVYTKTGDKGTTGLYTGERIDKDSLRVEAYGCIDEITSALGLARATVTRTDVKETIFDMQKMLMSVMADVASINAANPYITAEHVTMLETTIDKYDEMLKPLTQFLIPGDSQGSAALDMARTITRRAERNLLRLNKEEKINEYVLITVNCLSDLCFILGRVEVEVK